MNKEIYAFYLNEGNKIYPIIRGEDGLIEVGKAFEAFEAHKINLVKGIAKFRSIPAAALEIDQLLGNRRVSRTHLASLPGFPLYGGNYHKVNGIVVEIR